jgi:hypothetical protein
MSFAVVKMLGAAEPEEVVGPLGQAKRRGTDKGRDRQGTG